MILLLIIILSLILLLLLLFVIGISTIGGAVGIIIFGDIIVCMLVIAFIIKKLISKR